MCEEDEGNEMVPEGEMDVISSYEHFTESEMSEAPHISLHAILVCLIFIL